LPVVASIGFIVVAETGVAAQSGPDIHVVVNMVQLNVAVTDRKGNYITGLTPKDFAISEDGILETPATFAEGNGPARNLVVPAEKDTAKELMVQAAERSPQTFHEAIAGAEGNEPTRDLVAPAEKDTAKELMVQAAERSPQAFHEAIAGSNVYVLFDTSDYMYRGFVFAQDAISDFIRALSSADKIAFYSYSRDLSRAASLTGDRSQVLRAVRSTVAGDQAALYNCLLLTLKDADQNTGRKVVVVFSNGPDNSSVVPPEDVAEFAQSAGIPVYMVSTQEARLEPVSTAVFERMTAATGGKAYFAKNWRDERRAFASIRDDLEHLYSLSYYPKSNPNNGWRTITVKLVGDRLRNYRVRTRSGYRPQPSRFSGGNKAALSDSPSGLTQDFPTRQTP
jgi:VWFA-related protein